MWTLEKVEQAAKEGRRVPKRYRDLVDAIEGQERERIEWEEQAGIDEASNQGWNAALYDWANGKVTGGTAYKMAKKHAKKWKGLVDVSESTYVSLVEELLLEGLHDIKKAG